MTDKSFRLQSVITLPEGTLLEYGNGSRETVYFYDSNNNLELDRSDKKIIETEKSEYQVELRTNRVGETDIQRFGPEAKKTFGQARKERLNLPSRLPPQKSGKCVPMPELEIQATTIEGLTFNFQPPLTAQTLRAPRDQVYNLMDLLHWKANLKPLDPSRCFQAQADVFLKKILGLKLDPKEVEISTGNLLALPVLITLGLKNGEGTDAVYQILHGAERVHLDLSP